MSEEEKVKEKFKGKDGYSQYGLTDVLDTSLAVALKSRCLDDGGLSTKGNIDELVSLLDASIKFHQLVILVHQREEIENMSRMKLVKQQAEDIKKTQEAAAANEAKAK